MSALTLPLRRLFALCLLLVGAQVALAQTALPRPTPSASATGTLVIIGGALKDGNEAVWQAVVQAAGGPGQRLLILPTASADPQRTAQLTAEQLQRRGALTETLPIAPQWPGSSAADALAQAHEARWVTLINQARGVFLTGGEQNRQMDTLRPQGRETPVLAALRALLARGGVIAGTSAGAAVMSETAIRGLDEPFDALLRPLDASELGTGFGLAPVDLVTDQHFLKRGRVARLLRVLLQSGRTLGLGVEEDSAAVLRDGVVQAIGARGLLVIDSSAAQVQQAAPLAVTGVRLTYVDRSDRFDLHTRRVLTPATRVPLKQGQPQGKAAFFGDILGDNLIVGALAHAAEADGRLALGLAWRREQAIGFEWRIGADEQTRAFGGPTRDDHTLERLWLDIVPVRLSQPVYTPWPGAAAAAASATPQR